MPDGSNLVSEEGPAGAGAEVWLASDQREEVAGTAACIEDPAERKGFIDGAVRALRHQAGAVRPGPEEHAALASKRASTSECQTALSDTRRGLMVMGWCRDGAGSEWSLGLFVMVILLGASSASIAWNAANWLVDARLLLHVPDGAAGLSWATLLMLPFIVVPFMVGHHAAQGLDRDVAATLAKWRRAAVVAGGGLVASVVLGLVAHRTQMGTVLEFLSAAGSNPSVAADTTGMSDAAGAGAAADFVKAMLGLVALAGMCLSIAVLEGTFSAYLHVQFLRGRRQQRGDSFGRLPAGTAARTEELALHLTNIETARELDRLRAEITAYDDVHETECRVVSELAQALRNAAAAAEAAAMAVARAEASAAMSLRLGIGAHSRGARRGFAQLPGNHREEAATTEGAVS